MNAQTETEDLLPVYNFDYSKAKQNLIDFPITW